MPATPLQVLLADDDKDDCQLFEEAITASSISTELIIVNDGEQLIKQLTKKKTGFPDVVFLDLNMPRKNGFECLAEIKAHPTLKDLPVIILSTSLDRDIAARLYKMGARFYIIKPTRILQFKKLIHLALTEVIKKGSKQPSVGKFMLKEQLK